MRKPRAGIFTLSSSSIIVCESLICIVVMFLDTFLVSQLLKLTPGDYTGVSIFNFIYYVMIALVGFALGPLLRRWKKGVFVSVGSIVLAGLFVAVYLLGDQMANWVWLLGCISGLGYGIFDIGFTNLVSEAISSKHQTVYFSVKNILIFLVKTVFPLVLGSIIDMGSFPIMCVILALICGLIFVFSFLVKVKPGPMKTYNVVKFWKKVKTGGEETKPLKTLLLSGFLRGFCFDLLATVFTIMIFLSVGSSTDDTNFKIGLIQTIFTATQMISMFIFLKAYHKRRAKWFIFGSLALILASSIPVFITHNLTTILIFYGVYTFFRIFITTVTDMRRTSVIRLLSMHSHSLEWNGLYGLVYNITRGASYLSLLLFFVMPEWLMINIVLAINLAGYIGYSISLYVLEKQLIIQDINWKKAHPDPLAVPVTTSAPVIPEEHITLPHSLEKIEILDQNKDVKPEGQKS